MIKLTKKKNQLTSVEAYMCSCFRSVCTCGCGCHCPGTEPAGNDTNRNDQRNSANTASFIELQNNQWSNQ